MTTMSMRTLPALLLLTAVCTGLPSCGGDTSGQAAVRLPADLPAISGPAKVRFALDRILQGPLPRTRAFAIADLHALNLFHAREDLKALPTETIELLSDANVRSRITTPVTGDRNPWHAVLEVIAALPEPPSDLVEPWTEPALTANDLPLDRRAVRALLASSDAGFAPLLLAFLKHRPTDREVAPSALRALVSYGSPWREQALETVLRAGAEKAWSTVTDCQPGAECLIWWSLLAEAAGSAKSLGNERSIVPTWYPACFLLDDTAWPQDLAALDRALPGGRHVAPADVIDAAGFLPVSAASSAVTCWQELLTSGRRSAAHARCMLGKADHAFYADLVRRDLSGADPDLRDIAERCGLAADGTEDLQIARALLDPFLRDIAAGNAPSGVGIAGSLGRLYAAAPEDAAAAAVVILRGARPPDKYTFLLEVAYDLYATHDVDALRALLSGLARDADPENRATALTLIRRSGDVAYAPVLDQLLDRALLATEETNLRRLLIWLHAGEDVEEEALEAFAPRYVAWIEEAPDGLARALAPGLLDLGEPGARAYAEGLGGRRRSLYIQGLLKRRTLILPVVAEALLSPLDATTSREERVAILVVTYRVAPMDAAPHLAAALHRLDPAVRAEAADVLEVLRHRAR